MPKPNFLIIGIGKSGTTSLYQYLRQHPEIYMSPIKEPNFFVYNKDYSFRNGPIRRQNVHAKTFEEYLKLFDGVVNQKAIGEASPSNFCEWACDRVRQYLPDARFIAIFRHPIDRAYAQFLHRRRVGFEKERSFLTAYRASELRKEQSWAGQLCYNNHAYVPVLQYWLSRFPRERFSFYLTDDLKANPLSLVQNVFRFLEVDTSFKPDVSKVHNPGFGVRSQALSRFLIPYSRNNPLRVLLRGVVPKSLSRKLVPAFAKWNRIPAVEPIDPELRRQLTNELRDNILKLQDLIGCDLSQWLA